MDDNFSKGLSLYFHQYHYYNTVFEDFIDKMIEASGDKFNNLKGLCFNWIQKAGLNEIPLDIDYDKITNKINKLL